MTTLTGTAAEGPSGIGGWMILPIIGFAGTIALTFINLVPLLAEPQNMMTIFTSNAISTQFKLAVGLSLGGGLLIIVTALTSLARIFKRSPAAPRTVIVHLCVLLAVHLVEFWGDGVISAEMKTAADPNAVKTLVRSLIYVPIWLAYFAMSRRVRNTFRADAA